MRTRVALPILLASASMMVCGLGLGLAAAQEQPQITPRLPLQTQDRLRPAVKALQGRNQQQAQQQQQQQAQQTPDQPPNTPPNTPPGNTTGGGNSATPPTNIQEFDTGIDYRPTPPGARVTFNLEDADLPDLVRLISSITGKRFILPGKARSIKATVYAPTKVTAAEAYQAFLSILELNGMTVVPSGRYLKIVESTGIEGQPIPTYTGGSATPGDDRFVTRMHRVENVSAEDVANLLTRFKTREGSVTAYAPTNTVIITDMGSNIRRMLRVVESIDVPRGGEQVWIEPIHYVNATEMATMLQEIFPVGTTTGGDSGGASRGPAAPRRGQPRAATAEAAGASASAATVGQRSGAMRITKILPDERSNSLVILATERAYLRILELIRQLDIPLEGEGGIHVHYLQHGDSEEIAGTLSSLIGGGGGGGSSGGPRSGAQAAPQATAAAAAASGPVFEGDIRIVAHAPSNALVITSSLHDYAALRHVIERLDAPRRQVFIDAVIMEMNVNRSTSLGISFHGGAPNVPADGSLFIAGSNAQSSIALDPTALTGLALGVRGPTIPEAQQLIGLSIPAFGVAINALATSGDTNILSTPHIIAMDNEEAEISVGQNVPLQTSGFGGSGGSSGLAGLAGLAGGQAGGAGLAGLAGLAGGFGGNVPRQDVGTSIHITPHINDADEVRLEIEEEISEAQASTEGTLGVRSISKRTAKTQMVVRDQQTVVIGGLMRDTVINDETKIPVLGDIPLLGVLFRQSHRTTQKVNLLLFLTPYIVRDASDLRSIYERKMRERQQFIDRYFVFGDQEYEPYIDYTRTRGLVLEITNELDSLSIERELAEAALARPPPEHVPRAAVGMAPELDPEGGAVIITPEGESPIEQEQDSGNDLPSSALQEQQQQQQEE